jgi:hypothetical protein
MDFGPGLVVVVGVLLIGALVWFGVKADIRERENWQVFAQQHDCKVTGKKASSSSTGVAPIIGGNGGIAITTSTIPAQTGWLCDDGITYWNEY